MKRLILDLFCLLPLVASSQELERLHPVKVVSIAPVPKDTTHYDRDSPEWFEHIMDTPKIDFFECRGDTGVVGYLMKTSDSSRRASFEARFKGRLLDEAWLPEVQRAEEVLAEVLNLRADSAQHIAEALTAPRAYGYTRQYLFYRNAVGDTCVYVTCTEACEEVHLERSYSEWCDGDDTYWHARLNLTQRHLMDYNINGPTIKYVDGRSKEPRGLDSLSFFGWLGGAKEYFDCDYDELPQIVRRHLPKEYHIDGMTTYDGFRYEGNNHYIIYYSNGTEVGFDHQGHWLYLYKRDGVTLEELKRVTGSRRVYEAVVKDMAARGRDFPRYGWMQAVECVKDCFVVEVIYYPSKAPDTEGNANDMYARYTIDKKGRIVGIIH